jgi:hypothetical protein
MQPASKGTAAQSPSPLPVTRCSTRHPTKCTHATHYQSTSHSRRQEEEPTLQQPTTIMRTPNRRQEEIPTMRQPTTSMRTPYSQDTPHSHHATDSTGGTQPSQGKETKAPATM